MCCSRWEPTRPGPAGRCGSRWATPAPRRTWTPWAWSSARPWSGLAAPPPAERGRLADRPGADDVHGGDPQDDFVVLVDQLGLGANQATVWLGTRAARLDDRGPQPQRIARSHRRWPAELVEAGGGETGHPGQVVIDEHAHHDPGRMPSAGDQAAERPVSGELRVDVHRLRIELPRKVEDLRLGHRDVPVLVHASGRVILQVAVVDRYREVVVAQGPGAPGRVG